MQKVFSILLICSSVVFAEVKLSSSYSKCMDKSGGVTTFGLDCMNIETEIQDKKLNKFYKSAMKMLEPKKQAELKDVQRFWIKHRDAQCGFYIGLTGGTMDNTNSSSCFLTMTAERAQELESIAGML